MAELTYLEKMASDIRKQVIKMAYQTHSGHIGPALSCVEILTALYFHFLNVTPHNTQNKNRDRFILSKGHAANALYATLFFRGFLSETTLHTFLSDGSFLGAHPTYPEIAGIEFATGSLGHGLSVAVGLALAAKRDEQPYRTVVLLSDGECEEGSTWEAALSASHFELDNLIAIVDYNRIQAIGTIKDVLNLEPFLDKWKAFGFSTQQVDGHNLKEITKALSNTSKEGKGPHLILADTIKGKGISFLENTIQSHYHVLDSEQYQKIL